MAPHAEEPKPDSGVDLIQHDGTKQYGDWRDEFHKTGVAVVKGVVTPERAAYYRQKQVEWLQSFGLGFDPNDESTWTQEHLPVAFKGGMYFGYASNHEKYVWEARTEPKVVEVFEKLWETNELIVSFDGQNVSALKSCKIPQKLKKIEKIEKIKNRNNRHLIDHTTSPTGSYMVTLASL